jgi:hypothetical protein
MEQHESTEDIIEKNQTDATIARSTTATSLHDLSSNKELTIQDTESLIQTAPEVQIEPETKPRIASRSTITPHELYHETESDLTNNNNPFISEPVKHSRPSATTPIATDDLLDKSSSFQIAPTDSTDIVPFSSSSTPLPPTPPPADNNVSGLVAYFFSDFGNEGEGEEDVMPIDQNNFVVPTGAEIIADDDISSSLMGQSQASLLILHSAHVPRQQQQQQLTSTVPLTTETNNEYIRAEEKEEIESKEIDATKKRIATVTSISPSPSPSPKQVLPTSIIDDMQTQFNRNNNTSNADHHRQPSTTTLSINAIDSNIEEQEKRSNNSQIRLRSPSSTTSQMHSRNQSTTSERNNEQIKKNKEETRSVSSTSRISLKNIDNERMETPERIDSADQRLKSLPRPLSRGQSTTSNHTKKDAETTRTNSSAKTSSKDIERENSISRRSISRQPSITPSEQSHSSQRKSTPLRPASTNHEIGQSLNILLRNQSTTPIDDIHRTPTNENEPHTFSVESEHFLHNKSQTPNDHNQRLPSGYSVSRANESRRSSTASPLIPVTLDSPDIDNTQPPTSRTVTPMRKTSISSIDAPPDPNMLLTTTDEPDPNDPSIINSTLHFQMLSSHQPNNDISVPERDEPSPLINIVPLQEFPSRAQSVELPSELLPTEEHSHERSPTVHRSPSGEIEREHNNELPPVSPEIDIRLPSASPSNHEQKEPLYRTPSSTKSGRQQESPRQTPSPSKSGQQQQSSRHSPLLSYPARLEDLMRPTPSPFHSADEHKHHQEQEHNDRLPSISPPINETNKHDDRHSEIHQTSPSKFEQNNIRSPSSSPRRSELSDTNHTSVEGDETDRQQLDSPVISPKNQRIISPAPDDHMNNDDNNNHNHYQTRKRAFMPPPPEPIFVPENEVRPSSEKSDSSIHRPHEQHHDEHLYRNDVQLSSASIKLAKHHSPRPPSSPTRSTSNEEELPTMTASQQHSKLSLRLRQQEPKRKKSINHQQLPPTSSPLPQIDVGIPRERHIITYSIDHLNHFRQQIQLQWIVMRIFWNKNPKNDDNVEECHFQVVSHIFKWKNDNF